MTCTVTALAHKSTVAFNHACPCATSVQRSVTHTRITIDCLAWVKYPALAVSCHTCAFPIIYLWHRLATMSASLDFVGTIQDTIHYTLGGDQRSIDIVYKLAIEVQSLKKKKVTDEYISLDRAVSDGDLGRSNVVG